MVSFSLDKKEAKKFGDNVTEIKVKPNDVYGSYQTIVENEVLVPKEQIKKYNDCLDPYDDREFEEQILWFTEHVLGMLPPGIDLGITDSYGDKELFNEWEKEDV